MLQLSSGHFFGHTTETTRLDGLTVTDTQYIHDRVDWHYHERPYFTFLLQGGLIEGNKKTTHQCESGALLFHNWQEPHYNIKPPGDSRGLHVELDPHWLKMFEQDLGDLEGDLRIDDPDIKFLFRKIFLETKVAGAERELATHSLLLEVLTLMKKGPAARSKGRPAWVARIREVLHDMNMESPSLVELSHLVGIHPVHLSREFPRYFGSTMGAYIRKLKVDQALSKMSKPDTSLSSIAYDSGFADQSHFIRSFREIMGMTPSTYRRLLLS